MPRRLFTPVHANRTLPLVRRIVEDILRAGRELRTVLESNEVSDVDTDGGVRATELREEIRKLIAELEGIGCFYKDWGFDKGLVDFPSKIEGRRVLLCWRSDESSVAFYHGYEDGYAGRRPIPAALLGGNDTSESEQEQASDAAN